MKFNYTGVTRQRENVTGTLEAEDETEARVRLRSMQIRPTEVTPATAPGPAFDLRKLSLGPPVNLKGIMVFTRQFSSLIDSGVPVVQCLDILHQQERPGAFKDILLQVKEDIEGGAGLAESLAKHPRVFSDFFVRIVEAGEISGTLDKALRRVGVQLEKLGRLKAKVIGALLYPCITVVAAIAVLIFLLVKVIPEIAKLYTQSNAQLPVITTYVLELSSWFQANWYLVLGGIAGAVGGSAVLAKSPDFRRWWDPLALKIPLFGALIQKSAIARLTRTLSTLVASGVPLLSAFDICAKLMSNYAIRGSVEKASAFVSEGKTIAQGLGAEGFFPPMVLHMVNIGEMTGRLDELLSKVADIYDDEVDDAVGNLTGLLQPALIVCVGAMIAFLLMAMYLPIFQLADKMSGSG